MHVPELREPHRTALTLAANAWQARLGQRLISLVLFGSVARGEAREDSDVDLLVVAAELPRSFAERRKALLDALGELSGLPPVTWNLVVKSPEEARHHSPLYLDLVEDAVLLVDTAGFFAAVLGSLAARMRELGSRRVRLPDGSWYWDLKPDYRAGDVVDL